MVRDYEVMYIVRPDLDDEGLTAAMESVETTVVGQGGEVVRTTPWGKRRLAYEIDRMRDGNYVLLHVQLDGAKVKEFERLLHINENVVRHLVTLWVDTRGKDGEGEEDGAEAGEARERGERGERRRETREAENEEEGAEDGAPVAAASVADADDESVDDAVDTGDESVDDAADADEDEGDGEGDDDAAPVAVAAVAEADDESVDDDVADAPDEGEEDE